MPKKIITANRRTRHAPHLTSHLLVPLYQAQGKHRDASDIYPLVRTCRVLCHTPKPGEPGRTTKIFLWVLDLLQIFFHDSV